MTLNIFSCAYGPLGYLLWRNVYVNPLFNCNLLFVFELWGLFTYSGYKSLLDIWFAKMSPNPWVLFSPFSWCLLKHKSFLVFFCLFVLSCKPLGVHYITKILYFNKLSSAGTFWWNCPFLSDSVVGIDKTGIWHDFCCPETYTLIGIEKYWKTGN